MATLFEFEADFDLSKANQEIDNFAKKADKATESVIKDFGEIESKAGKIKIPSSEIDKLADSFQKVTKEANQSLASQEKALAQLIVAGKKGTKEYEDLLKATKANTKAQNELDKAISDVRDELKALDGESVSVDVEVSKDSVNKIERLKGAIKTLGAAAVVGGVVAAGAAVAGIAQKGIEAERAMRKLQATTGATDAEAQRLRQSAENLFVQGFGEDLGSAIESFGRFKQQFEGIATNEELEQLAPTLAGIAEATGTEFDEIAAKSRTFIQNFGLDVSEAGSLIAAVAQGSANAQQDTFDTLDEYSNLMAKAGFSAQQFGRFLIEGVEGGARSTDKLADALKEAQIRIEASDYSGAFEDLSKNANSVEREYIDSINNILRNAEEGNISIAEALALSGEEIERGVDAGEISEALQSKLAVAIAGTPTEDIGADLFTSLIAGLTESDAESELTEAGTRAAELYQKAFSSGGQGFEGLQRQIEVLAGRLGEQLLPVITIVTESIGGILPVVQPLIEALIKTLAPILIQVTDLIKALLPAILPIVETLINSLNPVIEALGGAFIKVVEAIAPLLVNLADLISVILPPLIEILVPVIDLLGNQLARSIKFSVNFLNILIDVVKAVGGAVLPILADALSFVITKLDQFGAFVDKIVKAIGRFLGLSKEEEKALNANAEATADATKETKKLTNANTELSDSLAVSNAGTLVNTASLKNYGSTAKETEKEIAKLAKTVSASNVALSDFSVTPAGDITQTGRPEIGSGFAEAIDSENLRQLEEAQAQIGGVYDELVKISTLELESIDFEKLFETDFSLFTQADTLDEFWQNQIDQTASFKDAIKENFNEIAGTVISTYKSAREAGDSFWEATGKAILQGVKQAVNALIPQIFAQSVALFGPVAGPILAGSAVLAINALIPSGAEEGGVVAERIGKKPTVKDTVPMMLTPREFVISEKGTNTPEKIEALRKLNAGAELSEIGVGTNGKIISLANTPEGKIKKNTTITQQRFNDYTVSTTDSKLDILHDDLRRVESRIKDQITSVQSKHKINITDNRVKVTRMRDY